MKFSVQSALRMGGQVPFTIAFLLMANTAPGQEASKGDSPSSGYSWSPVTPSSRITILEMLRDHTQGHYEQLRTWKVTYSVRLEQYVSQAYVANALSDGIGKTPPSSLMQQFSFLIDLAIDIDTGAVFRSKHSATMTNINTDSKEVVNLKNVEPAVGKSIVTHENFITFAEDKVTSLKELPDRAEFRNKRVAFRRPAEEANNQERGELLDPRTFFGFSTVHKFWEDVSIFIGGLKGEYGEPERKLSNDIIGVDQATRPDGTWYRVRAKLGGPAGKAIIMTSIWSPSSGYEPVSVMMANESSPEKPMSTMSWKWHLVDGVYIPWDVKEVVYNGPNGSVSYKREAVVKESGVNPKLDEDQFDYVTLGLKDGDLIVDRIERNVLIMAEGKPTKLAAFGEAFTPPSATQPSLWRWPLLIANGLIVTAVIAWLLRRWLRRA